MAVVVTQHTQPDIISANAYLRRQGYINCGYSWLRGQHGYARMEHTLSGAIRIIEGVA